MLISIQYSHYHLVPTFPHFSVQYITHVFQTSFRHNLLYIALSIVLLQLTWPIIQYIYETNSLILLLTICFHCDDVPIRKTNTYESTTQYSGLSSCLFVITKYIIVMFNIKLHVVKCRLHSKYLFLIPDDRWWIISELSRRRTTTFTAACLTEAIWH